MRENSSDRDVFERENSAYSASKILGFDWGDCYKFKDNALDAFPMLEVVKAVDKAKLKYKPSLVYTHSGADLNVDHRVVANAVLTSFRPQPGEVCKELRLFEGGVLHGFWTSCYHGLILSKPVYRCLQ